ncbi:DNA mismatch repair protein, MutS family [Methanosarcina thermophila]|jgi:DNA mismatch repair protein MutS2|uniref:DNA-binding protein MutS2 n=3 Tax=Methanosarcina thermophila TaxID=2210 RepID=A0A1I6ZJ83_METTE|nr:endonuclease MutS2 [Methanosarcina thermophila]AKB13633.1 DNA mismatch repair protein [Methanosarcina thermophila TM-1]ALK04912.1 MAG: DNA mismatch repair protein MutS [Methanosarcina sp. 795]AKB15727.1 DNA mismatch repair protein [Methanosarcina thermophila CHTI-55]NLU58028.1 endonuclease MutS2 [Methanosarcina thermophila]SFT62717.1 DNA mismatch repair protein, MutS family [Methanosarcina thermophila]
MKNVLSTKTSQPLLSLREIHGIGERVADKLIEHFGTEDAALQAICEGDIASLSEINGISHNFALSLAREARSRTEGCSISDFLKTKEALELYSRLLELIKSFAHTTHSRDRLNLFYPLPASRMDLIQKRQAFIGEYLELGEAFSENSEFLDLLSRVRKLKPVPANLRVRDRIILCGDPKILEAAREKFQPFLPVQGVEDFSEFVDLARGYSSVIVFDDTYLGFDLPEGIEPEYFQDISRAEFCQVLPEKELSFFARNLYCIRACLNIVSALRSQGFGFFEGFSEEKLGILNAALSKLGEDGKPVEGFDPEIDRLGAALQNLDSVLTSALNEANQRMNRTLEASSLTLSGQELIKLVSGGMEIKDLLAKELDRIYKTEIKAVKEEIADKLGLQKQEKLMLESLFPDEISYPLSVDQSQLQLLRQKLNNSLEKTRLARKRELAKTLSAFHQPVEQLVKEILDFDLGFSIACFSAKFQLKVPKLIRETGIGFEAGENLFLKARHGEIDPVSYSIGKTSFSPAGLENRVVLLSGVNSGGKTSLLELIAQCVILGYMGFPVPAKELELGPVEEFYYFGKSKGTLDAGAFETTLKQFSMLSEVSGKLVLADELESITEPGASARIIAGILEYLYRNEQSLGIFVSHLSELILENTGAEVRVDGIEADGLDSNLELIVNRNPVYNRIARSTPELIVERLLRKTTGKEQEFYSHLKNKFRTGTKMDS